MGFLDHINTKLLLCGALAGIGTWSGKFTEMFEISAFGTLGMISVNAFFSGVLAYLFYDFLLNRKFNSNEAGISGLTCLIGGLLFGWIGSWFGIDRAWMIGAFGSGLLFYSSDKLTRGAGHID